MSTQTEYLSCDYCKTSWAWQRYVCSGCGEEYGYFGGFCPGCGALSRRIYSSIIGRKYPCESCNATGITNCPHGYSEPHTYTETCSNCEGKGTITTAPCTHGYNTSHRYCEHYKTTTRTSHKYCSHGYTSQHD